MQKEAPSGNHRMASWTAPLFKRDMSVSGKVRGGGTPATAVEEMGVSVGEEPACGIATPVRLLLSTLTENASLAPALW